MCVSFAQHVQNANEHLRYAMFVLSRGDASEASIGLRCFVMELERARTTGEPTAAELEYLQLFQTTAIACEAMLLEADLSSRPSALAPGERL